MCSAVFYRMESAVKELRTLLANLEGGVALKATDYLGDCRYCMVYKSYIIICWCGFRGVHSINSLHAFTTQVVLL
jgi:hypothetical protein